MIYLFKLREIEWFLRFYIFYWTLFESPIVLGDGINVVGVSNSVPMWPFSKLPKTSSVKWSASLYAPIEFKLILFLFIFGTYQALLFKRMSYLLHSSSLPLCYLILFLSFAVYKTNFLQKTKTAHKQHLPTLKFFGLCFFLIHNEFREIRAFRNPAKPSQLNSTRLFCAFS